MSSTTRTVVAAVLCLFASGRVFAQTVTTGALTGVISDAQGAVVPGVTVTAVHEPTGSTYETVSGADGRYTMANVRVGGPYHVIARLTGFREQQTNDVQVALGENREVDFTLEVATISEAVTVVAETRPLDTSRAGAATNVPREAIETLPTVARSLFDFARVSPYFAPIALNEDPNSISVAGQNNRYNNIQIDGAVNNDLFGIGATGTPSGQTESEPVSLDAIQELQLVVSPYDVRQGMFAGGGINAITRSGSNTLHGTGYYFGRNQALTGESPEGTPIADFSSHQFGASAGGPLVKNRVFYFANADFGRKTTPSGFSINSTGQRFGLDPEADRFVNILKTRYNYTPGTLGEFIRDTRNNKLFVRSDLNLGPHQLTVRHNFIDGGNDIGRPTVTRFLFADNFYRFRSRSNSTVGQLNSTFGRSFNELRVTYQRIRDSRGGQPDEQRPFPQIDVRVGGGSRFLRAGREQFSAANELDQDVIEVTNDFTTVRGNHSLTFGTHNEFFKFRNFFIRDAFGTYTFASLDLLEQGFAQAYDYSFAVGADPRLAARFKVNQFGFYAGDQWRPGSRLTVTYGVRLDLPTFPDKPTRNPDVEAVFGYHTDVVPNQQLWSPRVGVTYALGDNHTDQIRGGVGYFAGRTPYVWLSNQYGNTGIEFQRIRVTENAANRIPFVTDVNAQARNATGATVIRNEIDLVDPDYTFPELVRGNLAYDKQIVTGLIATGELLYSKTLKDIKYQNINLRATGATRPDGRPVYAFGAPQFGDVLLLTNSDRGRQWSASFELKKPWRDGWFASAAYLYGEARTLADGNRSQAISNWNTTYAADPNNPQLTRSNFEPGHRLNLAYTHGVPLLHALGATASFYYSVQSGRPYSLLFSSDYNGDGQSLNDLLYIPRDANEVIFQGGTFDQFMAFVKQDKCRSDYMGAIHERNACRAPWTNNLDFRFAMNIPSGGRTKTELTFDLLNVANVINRRSGLVEYASFNDVLVARFAGIDAPTGKPIYDIASLTSPSFNAFSRDDLKSRWQGQVGARVRF